jgi:hypothetical protein
MPTTSEAFVTRALSRTVRMGDCLIWQGCVQRSGYGQVTWNQRRWLLHRAMWTALRGPIPADLTIDHLCRERLCVNVEHMEVVTMTENVLRNDSPPSRNARKERCPTCSGEYKVDCQGKRRCQPCTLRHRVAKGDMPGTGRLADHNRRKTHCPQGHPYDEANTYHAKRGQRTQRMCRACFRIRARNRRAAKQ